MRRSSYFDRDLIETALYASNLFVYDPLMLNSSCAPRPILTSLTDQTFGVLLESIAAKTPAPGGGAVASAVGALGSALAGMVVSYSVGKKSLAAHELALRQAAQQLSIARSLLLRLADEDAQAYGAVNELSRLPETDARRTAELSTALRAAVDVPLATIAACVDLLRLMESLTTITNRQLRSDLAIAAVLTEAAARSSRWNVAVNAGFLPSDADRLAAIQDSGRMVAECVGRAAAVEAGCGEHGSNH